MALFNVLFDIAAKTASFESSMTRVERRIDGMASVAKKAGAILGVTFAADQFRSFVVGAIESGDAMAKAATKAGAAVEEFSELAYAAQLADVQLDSLSKAVLFMQKAISNGADSFNEIGLSIADLQALQPDQQFEAIADAIAGIEDPADRARYAVEILGKSGADLLPLFERGAAGIRMARQEARELNKVLTAESAKAMQEADDSIKRLKASWEAFAQSVAIRAGPLAKDLTDGLRTLLGGATDLEKLETKLDFLRRFQDDPLAIPVLLNLGFIDGSSVVMGPDAVDKAVADIEAQIARLKQVTESTSLDYFKPFGKGAKRIETPQIPSFISPQMILEMERNFDYIEARSQEFAAMAAESAKVSESVIADIAQQAEVRVGQWTDLAIDENKRALDAMAENGEAATDSMSAFAEQAARNMQSTFAAFLFDPFENGVKGMAKGFIDTIRRMAAEAAAARLFESITGPGGAAGLLGSFLGALGGGLKPYSVTGLGATRLATGTNYVPYDNFPALLHKGEAVVPAKYNNGGGSPVVNVNIHNDNRGATQDFMKVAPELFKRQAEMIEAKIVDGLRRKRYAGI